MRSVDAERDYRALKVCRADTAERRVPRERIVEPLDEIGDVGARGVESLRRRCDSYPDTGAASSGREG